MHFRKIEEFGNLEMAYISDLSRGYISRNPYILKNLELNRFTQFLLERCVYGTYGKGAFAMKNISVIFLKQLKDTLKNKAVLIQFVMFPLMAVIMENTVKFEDMPEKFFVIYNEYIRP